MIITEEEKARRRESINYAKASMVLSGIVMPNELLQLADEFVEGKYTREEFKKKYLEAVDRGVADKSNTEKKSSYMMLSKEEIIKLQEKRGKKQY